MVNNLLCTQTADKVTSELVEKIAFALKRAKPGTALYEGRHNVLCRRAANKCWKNAVRAIAYELDSLGLDSNKFLCDTEINSLFED